LEKSVGIPKLTIFGDFMMVISEIIKKYIIGGNVFTGVMYLSLTLLKEFDEFSLVHTK
jgi:hypothetical protein